MRNYLYSLFGWVQISKALYGSASKNSNLPVHEMLLGQLMNPVISIQSLPLQTDCLNFKSRRFASAVTKAKCSSVHNALFLKTRTIGFCFENLHMFDWSSNELRLNRGMSRSYADYFTSSFAASVAEGMAILFLEKKNYAYHGRFEDVWIQKKNNANKTPLPTKAPDFIFENANKDWAIVEAKGSVTQPHKISKVTRNLKKGLGQIGNWPNWISPQPIKNYVVGTYLIESGGNPSDTSFICFVDPEPDKAEDLVEFPVDAVRRANYASWLRFMHLEDSAERLVNRKGDTVLRNVPLITLGESEYAFSILSVHLRRKDALDTDTISELVNWPFSGITGNEIVIEVAGLDFKVLKTLEATIQSPEDHGLMDMQPTEPKDIEEERIEEGGIVNGSVFLDGSLLGEITFPYPHDKLFEMQYREVAI